MKKTSVKSSFVKGALVLMIFGILSKIIGAIYRIPLTRIISPEGMGLYQMVFPVYSLMLTISSSGLPSSISKLVSENLAKNQYKQADRIMKVSFCLLFCFSVICSLIVVFGSKTFAKIQGNTNATICYIGFAPAIILVGLISGFRGYFQGRQKMFPSAISGFIEQLFKLIFGLSLAYLFLPKGINFSVLGAMIGISISEFFALIYLWISYAVFRKKHKFENINDCGALYSSKKTAQTILSTSIFVTLGSLIMPLGMIVDSALIINILKGISFSTKQATTLFGLESGTVGSIVNMPVILSLALSTAILPCVCSSVSKGDKDGARKSASSSLLLALLIALPASFGCFALAGPIIKLLYGKSLSQEEIIIASRILEVASISIFYLAMVQVSSGILQGISLAKIPTISLAVGMSIKIVLNLILIRIPNINILGAEVANAFCYLTAFLINLSVIKKKGFLEINSKIFIVLVLSIFVVFAKYIFKFLTEKNLNFYLAFLISILTVVLIYFSLVFLLYKKEIKQRKANTRKV